MQILISANWSEWCRPFHCRHARCRLLHVNLYRLVWTWGATRVSTESLIVCSHLWDTLNGSTRSLKAQWSDWFYLTSQSNIIATLSIQVLSHFLALEIWVIENSITSMQKDVYEGTHVTQQLLLREQIFLLLRQLKNVYIFGGWELCYWQIPARCIHESGLNDEICAW